MHNYNLKVYIYISQQSVCVIYVPTCFDTVVLSAGVYNQCLAKYTLDQHSSNTNKGIVYAATDN
jgi:hypothetical protein